MLENKLNRAGKISGGLEILSDKLNGVVAGVN